MAPAPNRFHQLSGKGWSLRLRYSNNTAYATLLAGIDGGSKESQQRLPVPVIERISRIK